MTVETILLVNEKLVRTINMFLSPLPSILGAIEYISHSL